LNKELGEENNKGLNENTGPLDVQKGKLHGEIKTSQDQISEKQKEWI
jgi:hypothetical protein